MLTMLEQIPSERFHVPRGSVVLGPDSPIDRLVVLLSGRVEVVTRQAEHVLIEAPTVVGEVSFLGRVAPVAEVVAVTDLEVRTIRAAALAAWGAQHPDRLTEVYAWLARVALQRVTGRFHDRYCALVAHDRRKRDLVDFVGAHHAFFAGHTLLATEHTGRMIADELGLTVARRVMSGPLGGDQEIGGLVSRGLVTAVFFFRDPLWAPPHQADVHALVRICEQADVPLATNVATAALLVRGMVAASSNASTAPVG